MLRTHRGQRPQDDQIERALKQFDAFSHSTTHPSEVAAERGTGSTGVSSGVNCEP